MVRNNETERLISTRSQGPLHGHSNQTKTRSERTTRTTNYIIINYIFTETIQTINYSR